MAKSSGFLKRKVPEVALLVETSTTYGRDVLSGIAAYVHENSPWSVKLEQRSIREGMPGWLSSWRGDGIISRLPLEEIAEFSQRTGIPVIDMNEQVADLGLPLVFNDQYGIGQMAAEHLLERGFQQFAYIGQRGGFWSDGRYEGFSTTVAQAGYPCYEYVGTGRTVQDYQRRVWETETPLVAQWVVQLPKPIGVMACNAFRACQLLDACRQVGVAVPEQIAVIAGDDEEVACQMALPSLSAVINSGRRIGYQAAWMLDQLMQGGRLEQAKVFIPPERITTRQSTDILAISDPLVAGALQFIRQNACHGINVEDVVRAVGVSRSTLQNRFRQVLGQTIHDLILNFRIRRARALLAETALPLEEVAERSGFKYVQYMSDVFLERVGIRPGKYRAQHRPASKIPLVQ